MYYNSESDSSDSSDLYYIKPSKLVTKPYNKEFDLDKFVTEHLTTLMEYSDELEKSRAKYSKQEREYNLKKQELLNTIATFDIENKYTNIKDMLSETPSELDVVEELEPKHNVEMVEDEESKIMETLQYNVNHSHEYMKRVCREFVDSILPDVHIINRWSCFGMTSYGIMNYSHIFNKLTIGGLNDTEYKDKIVWQGNMISLFQWKNYIFEYTEQRIKTDPYLKHLNHYIRDDLICVSWDINTTVTKVVNPQINMNEPSTEEPIPTKDREYVSDEWETI